MKGGAEINQLSLVINLHLLFYLAKLSISCVSGLNPARLYIC
jgi:hypothetical protein